MMVRILFRFSDASANNSKLLLTMKRPEPKRLRRSVFGISVTSGAGSKRQALGLNSGSIVEYGARQPVAALGLRLTLELTGSPVTGSIFVSGMEMFAGNVLPDVVSLLAPTLMSVFAKPRCAPYKESSRCTDATSMML